MKKYLAVFGAAIFVMALAAPAMAQFSSWGHMEIQTIWEERPNFDTQPLWANNTSGAGTGTPAGSNKDVTWRHVAERYRFYLQYGDPKTVRAVIGFEADSTEWGEPRTSGTVTGGRMGGYTADSVQLEIKHAYLDFMVPNTPVKVTAGVQAFAYGGRLLINNDGAGVTVSTNFAPHSLSASWVRFNDSNRYDANARDGYILDWKMVQKAFDVNVYGAFVNDQWSGQQATFTDPTSLTAIPIVNRFNQQIYYIGASTGFRPGNWTFFLHGLYVGGKRDFNVVTDTDIMAYAFEGMAKYQIGPGMSVLAEGFYASGNDTNSDNLHYFPTAQDSEARSIFGNDRTVFFWMNAAQIGYYHNQQIDFSGMWYGRGAFEYSPTAWMRMILNYLYIGDTSSGGAGTFTPKFAAPGTLATRVVNSPKGSRQDADKNYVGQEINLITTINIYKNFVYNIGLYYFIAGDVFDSPTKDASASYGINTKLNYAF